MIYLAVVSNMSITFGYANKAGINKGVTASIFTSSIIFSAIIFNVVYQETVNKRQMAAMLVIIVGVILVGIGKPNQRDLIEVKDYNYNLWMSILFATN